MNRLEEKFQNGLKVKGVTLQQLNPKERLASVKEDLTFGFTGVGGPIKVEDIWDPDADGGVGDFKIKATETFPTGNQT